MDCDYAIYRDKMKASDVKIHKVDCGEHKKLEGHNNEWFYSPNYPNAVIIAEMLCNESSLSYSDCQCCKPSP